MFPTAASTIYRNENGEVTGWDTNYGYEPDVDDFYNSYDDESPYDGDLEGCKAAGEHGVNADQNANGTWTCTSCWDDCTDEMPAD